MKKLFTTALICSGFVFRTQAQTTATAPSLSAWEMNKADGIVELPSGVKSRSATDRLALVYDYANVPEKIPGATEAKWEAAPVQNGVVSFGSTSSSILLKANYDKFTQLDFTYFRATLYVPAGFKVNQASVTVGYVDDQARVMLFNSLNPEGIYVSAKDGKRGGKDFTTDFTKSIVVGGFNTFKIVQVDDNCCGNLMTGSLTVKLNDTVIPVDPSFPQKFPEFIKAREYAEVHTVGSTQKVGDEYVLTPAQANKTGAFWGQTQIDLSKNFEIQAMLNFGTNDGGADGIALVFQNVSIDRVGDGGGMGYAGISPSYEIEFDTWQNQDYNDPTGDHVAKRSDGKTTHSTNPSDFVQVPNLEDGKFHPIVFTWYASSKTFDLKLDGKDIFKGQQFPSSTLSGTSVYFGFTGATGMAFNKQIVKEIYYSPK